MYSYWITDILICIHAGILILIYTYWHIDTLLYCAWYWPILFTSARLSVGPYCTYEVDYSILCISLVCDAIFIDWGDCVLYSFYQTAIIWSKEVCPSMANAEWTCFWDRDKYDVQVTDKFVVNYRLILNVYVIKYT